MTESELKKRTKNFALRILDLADALPQTRSGSVTLGPRRVQPLLNEANELTAIFVSSRKTAARQKPIENRKPKIENP
jgi:hypothetical protein